MNGCEVVDYVVDTVAGTSTLRTRNEAANVELTRRGLASEVEPSGEVDPYAIAWVNTCDGTYTVEYPDATRG